MPPRFPLSQGSEQSATSGTRATGPGSAWPAGPFHTVLLLLALSACGDNVPHRPTQVTITPQSATLTHIGATARFTARITDQNGENYPGTVTWSASDPTVFTVADDGVVTATGNGAGTLTASVRDISATALVNVEQLPFALVIISGDGQEGNAGEPLADPLVVRAEDSGGTPIEGLSVTFTTASPGASADPETAETDAAGLARTSWTLGWESGVQHLDAFPFPLPGESPWAYVFAAFAAAVGPLDPPSRSATYQVTFAGVWADRYHPNYFPSGARWSPLIGAVHSRGRRHLAQGADPRPLWDGAVLAIPGGHGHRHAHGRAGRRRIGGPRKPTVVGGEGGARLRLDTVRIPSPPIADAQRRGWDSNPRVLSDAGFQDRCIEPLCHPSCSR